MKRFCGLLLTGVGAAAAVWGGYFTLTGASDSLLHPLPVKALYGGLIGVALLTTGLIWIRD